MTSNITIEEYSPKSFVVRGSDTKKHKELLKTNKGKWNNNLKGGSGWIFSNKQLSTMKTIINGLKEVPVPKKKKKFVMPEGSDSEDESDSDFEDLDLEYDCGEKDCDNCHPRRKKKTFVMPECDCGEKDCEDCHPKKRKKMMYYNHLTWKMEPGMRECDCNDRKCNECSGCRCKSVDRSPNCAKCYGSRVSLYKEMAKKTGVKKIYKDLTNQELYLILYDPYYTISSDYQFIDVFTNSTKKNR